VEKRRVFDYGVTCIIMGGGAGTRLYPLTHKRAKPAVPVGAKFRLIDIPISNCLNSGLNRIYLLTQFNSTSLHTHISRTYHFDRFSRGFVEILAAQQSPEYTADHSWYEGNADAVRKNLPRIHDSRCDEVLILSGDQLYQMDYKDILRTHRGADGIGAADITIAALLVTRERARSLGVLRIDKCGRIVQFVEKPGSDDSRFEGLEAPPEILERFAVPAEGGPFYLANMGVYAFSLPHLEACLMNDFRDFGREVLPSMLGELNMRAHLFNGYWEDIGTIASFHQANIDLARENPLFDFYSRSSPVYTRARLLPASTILHATIDEALISDGCKIAEARIERSLIGIRSIVGRGCVIRDTFVMGNDSYESDDEQQSHRREGHPDLGVGDGSVIENAIVDKNVRIGRDVKILNAGRVRARDGGPVVIRDGIAVVPRGGIVPDGFTI
jgi:glucose-1-phosphate adenylyltransferase